MIRFSFVLGFLFAFCFLSNVLSQEVLQPEVKKVHGVVVTAFTASVKECGNARGITSSGLKVRKGIIACNFLPFGTKVRIPSLFGSKIFVVVDRMASRKKNNIDIFVGSREIAFAIGRSIHTIEVVG